MFTAWNSEYEFVETKLISSYLIMYESSYDYMKMPDGVSQRNDSIRFEEDDSSNVDCSTRLQLWQSWLVLLTMINVYTWLVSITLKICVQLVTIMSLHDVKSAFNIFHSLTTYWNSFFLRIFKTWLNKFWLNFDSRTHHFQDCKTRKGCNKNIEQSLQCFVLFMEQLLIEDTSES